MIPRRFTLLEKFPINDGGDREDDDTQQDDEPTDQRDRSLEYIPLGVAIDKRQGGQQEQKGPWEGNGSQELTKLPGENPQAQ